MEDNAAVNSSKTDADAHVNFADAGDDAGVHAHSSKKRTAGEMVVDDNAAGRHEDDELMMKDDLLMSQTYHATKRHKSCEPRINFHLVCNLVLTIH